jgi:hypothetical protein
MSLLRGNGVKQRVGPVGTLKPTLVHLYLQYRRPGLAWPRLICAWFALGLPLGLPTVTEKRAIE